MLTSSTRRHPGTWGLPLLLAAALFALAGCPSIQSRTPTEQLAVVYTGISAAATTTTARLEAGALTADQALQIHATLSNAKEIADTASLALGAGLDQDGLLYLQIASNILSQLEARLRQ